MGVIYHHQHIGQMAILNPMYMVPPTPAVQFVDDKAPMPMEYMMNAFMMAMHLSTLQVNQVNAMAAFQAAMNQPLPPAAPPINVNLPQCNARPNPPAAFTGKNSAATCHFLMEVNTFANITPFTSLVTHMQWTLFLCEEDTKSWHDQQLTVLNTQPQPAWATTWPTFQAHFEA
jgi:hypothetical protein